MQLTGRASKTPCFFNHAMEALPFIALFEYCEGTVAVTIYDVAKTAGVGIGTVSRAINDSSQINPNTKQRILKIIKQLNYQPHALAQSLARKRSNTVATIVPFFTNYFFIELLRGIQQKLTEHNYDLILYSVDKIDRRDVFLDRALVERRVDGVLLISLEIPDDYAERFENSNLPIVLVDSYYHGLDSITVDNVDGAYRATEHLIRLGHQKIGMINGHLTSRPAVLRLKGFKKALRKHNLDFDDRHLIICDATYGEDGFNEVAGYWAMKQLLELGSDMPTALFVASDIQAFGAFKAAREHRVRIPDDIALVGFDDIELAEFIGLTTMHQPIYDIGCLSVEKLIARISGQNSPKNVKILKTELVIRESCGAKIENK